MGRIVVFNSLTLDGVMQAPGSPDEDRRDDFEYGGWARPYFDPVMAQVAGEGMANESGLLFGRRTFEQFASYWPHQPDEDPFAAILNRRQKFVASRTLSEPLPWANSTLLHGDAADALSVLKAKLDMDLVVLGSGELIRSLMRRNLIDAFTLQIHPLILGSGRRLFTDDRDYAAFRLVNTTTTTTGVLIATYEPA